MAAKLDDAAIAGGLTMRPVMHGDGRIDEIAAQRRNREKRAILVPAGEAAVADDVGRKDRCDFPSFSHRAPQAPLTLA